MMLSGCGGRGGGGGGGRYPFTASQWQELEHQALIYKYMASGAPIPSDLILPIRRSFLLDTALATAPSLAFSPQPSLGWGCFQVGFGRKAEDPEPGRCRRTDGKKWRCSKEAYPDSKYCEKHMHRGKNRSRKPVEMSLATPAAAAAAASSASTSSPSVAARSPYAPALSMSTAAHAQAEPAPYGGHHMLYPYGSPARPPFQPQMGPFGHLHLDAAAAHTQPPASYYRYSHGMKEVDEHAFFSDGSERDHHGQWQFKQLGMGAYGGGGGGGEGYGKDDGEDRRRQQQHCFVLGADLRLDHEAGGGKAEQREAAANRPLRHFFDEWPHEKSKQGAWMGLEGETQLSISIPMAADLPITTTSRFRNDE